MYPLPWLRALVSNVQDAIVLLDESGNVTFESPSASAILCVPSTDEPSAFGLDKVHPEEREAVIALFEKTRATPGAVARAAYRFKRGDGEWQHLEALAKNLLDDPELRGVLITFRDVTDRIRALESAEQAGAARDQFLSRMSHELRTPLHAVLGWAQLLERNRDRDAAAAAVHIADAGAHLLRLVEDALELAAVREGRVTFEPEPLDLRDLLSESAELIGPLAAEKDLLIRMDMPAHAAIALVDRLRLRQVVLNLLGNAAKFNRIGGEIRIRLVARAGKARVSVADDGPGISGDQLAWVFERFARGEHGASGTGLGLAIARELIELMGGTVGVESFPGRGAEFWIEIPLAEIPSRDDRAAVVALGAAE